MDILKIGIFVPIVRTNTNWYFLYQFFTIVFCNYGHTENLKISSFHTFQYLAKLIQYCKV